MLQRNPAMVLMTGFKKTESKRLMTEFIQRQNRWCGRI